MSSFWLTFWACGLAVSWLLPNHFPPWSSFHSDAWCAVILMAGSAAVALQNKSRLVWHGPAVVVGVLVLIPGLQYAVGLIAFSGQAVIVSAYLLGLLLAILTGTRWEQSHPAQAINGLFLAIGIAGICSVCLQFLTWLQLIETGVFDLWSMGLTGERPYANLGQPNQLATLLLWGIVGGVWAYSQRTISGWVAMLFSAFLLVGVALTQSRTAWLGLAFLTCCSWAWRSVWPSKWFPWGASLLFAFFVLCYFQIHSLAYLLGVANNSGYFRGGPGGDLRLLAWEIFVRAAWEKPWFGYGWTELGKAQLEAVQLSAPVFEVFGHSHNLVLDLVLWLGIPLGIAASIALASWYIHHFFSVRDAKNAVLVLFLGVVGIHSMLELPVQYAYFLLPIGIVVGVVCQCSPKNFCGTTPRWVLIMVWVVAALLLAGIIRDYFRIESGMREVRFETARIGNQPVGKSPDVLLLSQLRDEISFMRFEVKEGMTFADLQWLKSFVVSYPTGGRLYKAAKAMALNGQADEANAWLRKVCRISSPDECALIQRVWQQDSKSNALIAAIPWPAEAK